VLLGDSIRSPAIRRPFAPAQSYIQPTHIQPTHTMLMTQPMQPMHMTQNNDEQRIQEYDS
jgi:hypothetical protein